MEIICEIVTIYITLILKKWTFLIKNNCKLCENNV